MKKYSIKSLTIVSIVLLSIFSSCSSNDCEYVTIEDISGNNLCTAQSILNLSTGIDESGNVIAPGDNVSDPYWRMINKPLYELIDTSEASLLDTMNGNTFIVNLGNATSTGWLNQNNSSAICPLNAGNASQGISSGTVFDNMSRNRTPYIFERPFCINDATVLEIDFTARSVPAYYCYFELIDNLNNIVLSTSQTVNSTVVPWRDSVRVSPGSYSIRAYVSFRPGGGLPALSLVGNVKTVDNSLALTNNKNNCCSNNVISLVVIDEDICDLRFDPLSEGVFGFNVSATIFDSSGNDISYQNADVNGNIIFAGLPDGTYTIRISVPDTIAAITPNNFTVIVSNNEVKNFNIFVCL